MLCTLLQTGFRKSEVALPDGESFRPGRLSRASLTWFVHGSYHAALSPALAASLSPGDAAVVVPPPSKADPFGLKFSSTPIYLPYDRDHVCNAAAHLAALEVRFPCSDRAPPSRSSPSTVAPVHSATAKPIGFSRRASLVC
ncbi:MAG: hypothetical protein AAF409_22715, partial [Pseudomonadota bacterium]